jgi:hypothetical protein
MRPIWLLGNLFHKEVNWTELRTIWYDLLGPTYAKSKVELPRLLGSKKRRSEGIKV